MAVHSAASGRTACLTIPITGITKITFNAVQVSVDPCAVRVIVVHDSLMSLTPIVFAGPPQRH
jgi:hypothetical protein